MELKNIQYPIYRNFFEEDGEVLMKITSKDECCSIYIEQDDPKDEANVSITVTKEKYDDLIQDIIAEYGEELITMEGEYKETSLEEKTWNETVIWSKSLL